MIVGNLVRLRPVGPADLAHFLKWFNDPEVIEFLDLEPPLTESSEREWLEHLHDRQDLRVLMIERQSDGAPVGTIGLATIDPRHRHAELGLTVGEKGEWGKGYGSDAVRALLAFAFGVLQLRKVSLRVHADHAAAIRLYEHCGFRREGFFRAEKIRRGTFVDEVAMAILKEEWEEPRVVELIQERVVLSA